MQALKLRILSSSAFILSLSCFLWLLSFPSTQFLTPYLILIPALLSLGEFYNLARGKKFEPLQFVGYISLSLYILATYYHLIGAFNKDVLPSLFMIAFLAGSCFHFPKTKQAIANLSITYFGIIYIGFAFQAILHLGYEMSPLYHVSNVYWIIYLIFVTKLADSSAYFAGILLGKHKMSPSISPSKTWEGLLGAFIGGIVGALLLDSFFPSSLSISAYLLVSFLTIGSGQIGDLFESLLKRDAKIKDSANIPGLGGVLDVLDSILFAAPVLYICLKIASL